MKIFPSTSVTVDKWDDVDCREIVSTIRYGSVLSERVELLLGWLTVRMSPEEARDLANLLMELTGPVEPARLSASAEKSAQQIPPDLAHWRYTVRRMDRKIAENVETRGKACSIALDKVLSSTRDVKQTTRQTREVMEEVRKDPMIRVLESEHKLLCWLREEAHYMCELNGGWA